MTAPAPTSPEMRLRAEWASALCFVLSNCHPDDAAQIMTAALQDREAGWPERDTFGSVKRDAAWWAETAPPHELQAYAFAALKQLAAQALGPTARQHFIAQLWQGLSVADKRAFVARVAGEAR